MTTLPLSGNYRPNFFPLYGKLVTNRKPLISEFREIFRQRLVNIYCLTSF